MKYHLITLALTLLLNASIFSQSNCEDGLLVSFGTTTIDDITGEDLSDIGCADQNHSAANWYYFTAEADETVFLTSSLITNANWDSRIQVFSGECGNLACVAEDDDGGAGFTSELDFNTETGVTYYITFDNRWSNDGGNFYLGNFDDVEDYNDGTIGGGGGGGENPLDTAATLINFQTENIPGLTIGVGVIDMNGDFLDDVVSTSANYVTVQYQLADGTFQQETLPTPEAENFASWSLTGGDLDNNGFNDLMYGGGSGVSLMLQTDEGDAFTQYASTEYIFSQRGNMVDVNNDGILDAFMCHDVAPNVYFLSDGEGGFEYYQGGLGETENGGNYGSIWIDYNNDCLVDLFIAKCRGGNVPENINQMHRNNGDGTFTEVGEEIGLADNIQTWSSAWADFDNDGDMDVFIGASSTSNGTSKMMRNDDGIFVDITAETNIPADYIIGIEHVCHDFNNDGFVDIDNAGTTMMLNNGDMTFTISQTAVSDGGVGDLNNDGYLDKMSAGTAYINQESGNNYLKINTIGTSSNKNGIGARITVTSDLGTQIRDVKAGDGFRSMASLTAHFGLGQDQMAHQITVCWPSGVETVLENVFANNTLNIVEVEGEVVSVENLLKEEFKVFPNPTSDFLNVTSDYNFNSFPVQIMSMNGQILIDTLVKDNRINVSELASGTYFITVNANGVSHQLQFIKS